MQTPYSNKLSCEFVEGVAGKGLAPDCFTWAVEWEVGCWIYLSAQLVMWETLGKPLEKKEILVQDKDEVVLYHPRVLCQGEFGFLGAHGCRELETGGWWKAGLAQSCPWKKTWDTKEGNQFLCYRFLWPNTGTLKKSWSTQTERPCAPGHQAEAATTWS